MLNTETEMMEANFVNACKIWIASKLRKGGHPPISAAVLIRASIRLASTFRGIIIIHYK